MLKQSIYRRLLLGVSTSVLLAVAGVSLPAVVGVSTPAYAQVSAKFQSALEPYGQWRRNGRFGEIWVPAHRPSGWRPYTDGRWVYTDDWGWYWTSADDEADWGWVTYHYGRWAFDREIGWFWVPGDEWAPAWVDWRRGGEYVGWAPAPPPEVVYDENPEYWIFVQPRYLTEPRVRVHVLPPQRTVVIIRQTVIVNRTVIVEHRDRHTRFAVNPGIAPGIVAAALHRPVQTFRVQPRVLAGTQGVTGAVQVRPQDLGRRGQGARGASVVKATLQPTKTVVQPLKDVPKPEALGRDERGRLGATPPHAAQGAVIAPQRPATPQQGKPAQQRTPAAPGTGAQPPHPVGQPTPGAKPRTEPPRPQPKAEPPHAAPKPEPSHAAPKAEPPRAAPKAEPLRPVQPHVTPPVAHPAQPPVAHPAQPAPPHAAPPPHPAAPPAAHPAAPTPPAVRHEPAPQRPGAKPPEEKK